jgi:hypothetical protein
MIALIVLGFPFDRDLLVELLKATVPLAHNSVWDVQPTSKIEQLVLGNSEKVYPPRALFQGQPVAWASCGCGGGRRYSRGSKLQSVTVALVAPTYRPKRKFHTIAHPRFIICMSEVTLLVLRTRSCLHLLLLCTLFVFPSCQFTMSILHDPTIFHSLGAASPPKEEKANK